MTIALTMAMALVGLATAPAMAGSQPPGGTSASGLADRAAAIESQLVSTGAQVHHLAVAEHAAAEQLAADTAAWHADETELASLGTALAAAETLSRRLALQDYMSLGGGGDAASAFAAIVHGTSTDLVASHAYQAMASQSESTAIDRYHVLQQVVARRTAAEAASRAAAAQAYQQVQARSQALQQTVDQLQSMLDSVRQQQAAMAAQAATQAAAQAAARAAAVPAAVPVGVLVAPSGSLAEDLYRLRECESGDDYQADTGNGYYGAYQFSLATWQGLGYQGLPSQAPPPEQDQAAITLEQRSGWGQWPVCAALLGLT